MLLLGCLHLFDRFFGSHWNSSGKNQNRTGEQGTFNETLAAARGPNWGSLGPLWPAALWPEDTSLRKHVSSEKGQVKPTARWSVWVHFTNHCSSKAGYWPRVLAASSFLLVSSCSGFLCCILSCWGSMQTQVLLYRRYFSQCLFID